MKFKSEVACVFQKFKALVENQVDCKIKVLRSDNGTEYTSDQFEKFCFEAGIEHQLTVTYTPQQNGVSERKNRTVMEMARCLLFEKRLPKSFWAEAVYTSVYLLNRLPTKVLKNKTPFEAWYETKAAVDHLKIFGCICYTHVPEVKRDKLDQKAEIGIFLGYSNNVKGYRVFNLKTKKVQVSRNVKFDESARWNWDKDEVETGSDLIVKDINHLEQGDNEVDPNLEEDDEIAFRGTRSISDIYERCNSALLEPANYTQAVVSDHWRVAMKEELRMIEKNNTWELVERPSNKNVIGVKWVYRTKLNSDGSVNKHKARLVVKGYSQQYGIDFSETFAPVARYDTIRLLIALAAQKGWKIYQLDVKSAFLNGYLKEQIFIEQPKGYVIIGNEDKVYLLRKALYGLKQAPRAWYSRIDDYLSKLGFNRSISEPTLYVKQSNDDLMIISLYVDDLLVTGNDIALVKEFKE